MKSVIAYIRVSTDGRCADDKFGLSVQRERIERYCDENEMRIVKWVADEGESGAKERPGFDSIVYDDEITVEGDQIEAVVVAKTDRVARDINIYYYYKMLLLKKDIKLISITEDFEAFGVFAPMLEAFTLCVANMERENITKRTTSGRRAKAKQGGFSGGKAPLGYCIKNSELVIDEREAEIVRDIYEFRKTGMSLRKIAELLNSKGYRGKSGGEFNGRSVKFILDNKMTYMGYYRYGDNEWVKGKQPAIIV